MENSILYELADFGLTNIMDGNVIQNPRIRRVAAQLDAFWQKFEAWQTQGPEKSGP